jgi:predicted aldo/keto reductase-like oxidoreductase
MKPSGYLKRINFGNTGISVSELCFGTLTMSKVQADLTPESTIPVFQRAIELGITFYDTASRYGTFDHLRLGLGRDIHNVVIASKTDARDLEQAKLQIDDCFRTLGRDMIDIYLLHQVDSEEEFQSRRPVLDHLLKLKSQSRIRAVGISTHKISGNKVAAHYNELDVLYPIINSQGLGIVDGTLSEALESIALAKTAGCAVYAMKPLGGGHLRRSAQDAFRWVRDNPHIDAVSVGMKTVDEVDVNVALFSDGKFPLDNEKAEKLKYVDRKTIINFLCTKCGACLEHCDQAAITLGERKAEINHARCILCGYCAPHCPKFAIRVI